jgi:XTP/dITP diphosphohydrolase
MINKLVFASANTNKVLEVEKKLGGSIPLTGLLDIGCTEEIPETGATLEANARQKAWYVWEKYHLDCFADDTGLEVAALNNEPGVRSARYAGDHKNSSDNIDLLLENLKGKDQRDAQFRTVICLIIHGEEYLFEGIAQGHILEHRRGEDGFGYDPVFVPIGDDRTFAEMSMEEKNVMSHRGKAIGLLKSFLLSR